MLTTFINFFGEAVTFDIHVPNKTLILFGENVFSQFDIFLIY